MIGSLVGDYNVVKKNLHGSVSGKGNRICGSHVGKDDGVGTIFGEEVKRASLFTNTQALLSKSESKSLFMLGPRSEEALRKRAILSSDKVAKKTNKPSAPVGTRIFATPKYHELIAKQDIFNYNKDSTNMVVCKEGRDKWEMFGLEQDHLAVFCKTAFSVGNPRNLKIVFGDYSRNMLSIDKSSLSYCRFDGMEVWTPLSDGKSFRFLSGEGLYEVDSKGAETINGKLLEF